MPLLAVAIFAFLGQFSQADVGELRLAITDQTGVGVPATVVVENAAMQQARTADADSAGLVVIPRLPFGPYRVHVTFEGFTPFDALIEIRSAAPTERRVTLSVAAIAASVDVRVEPTLLDPRQTSTVRRLGERELRERPDPSPGRALPEIINSQPGWLLEAGGTLHPRGSESQAQYVVDGLPLTDNRSPGFAPELDADTVHAIGVITGGYAAEYGRKLGGVIEVSTAADPRHGFHGDAALSVAGDSTAAVDAAAGYSGGGTIFASLNASTTDRYLDPPVEENFTNGGESWQGSVRAERGRIGAIVSRAKVRFQVPNDPLQQEAGQLQRRSSAETATKLSYQQVVSPSVVLLANGMARDLDAGLTSNEASTPIAATQRRGIREGYVKVAAAGHAGYHEWKVGADTSVGRITEEFAYDITREEAFAPGTRESFAFAGEAIDREHAIFVQDQIAAGPWTLKAGLRWDVYRLLVRESAISPRLAAAWSPRPAFSLRASFDRAFQTPATENLLLASSPEVDALASAVVRLPVAPSRGNFYEVAATQRLSRTLRVDGSWFLRRSSNFADDDLLLNSGVSFPIAFQRATIKGAELRLDAPSFGAVSGSISYGWMRGTAVLPVTGGLFLGSEIELGEVGHEITITQDQRHTIRGRISARLPANGWMALSGTFDSGLPFEDEGEALEDGQEFSQRILERVNLETGRVRSATVLDFAAGWRLKPMGGTRIHVQGGIRNVTDTLRVINFAGVLSGTALAAPRTFTMRVRVEF